MPVTANAGFVAQRITHRPAETDPHVFDRMVLIDVQIAFRLDRQVDRRVLGQQHKHVIEEPYAGGDGRFARAIEIDLERDVRFSRFA